MAFLQRMNVTIPTSFLKRYQQIKEKEEIEKVSQCVNLCESLKLFGQCTNEKCKNRHRLSKDLDFATELNGYIKFEILSVEDVTTYTVRIIMDDTVTKNSTDVAYIERRLQELLEIEKENVEKIIPGEWVATLEADQKSYRRCEVLKQLDNATVRIFYLDDGLKGSVTKSNLYKLPEELKRISPQGSVKFGLTLLFSVHKNLFGLVTSTLTKNDSNRKLFFWLIRSLINALIFYYTYRSKIKQILGF